MYIFNSENEENTIQLAYTIAKVLEKGDIIVLNGELGAGKTKFTQGILKYFGLEKEISSPTFTIVNEYTKDNVNIYHFDVYRLEDEEEFYAIGGEEYFQNGICIIEWGELIKNVLPKDYIEIKFNKNDDNLDFRTIEIYPHGEKMNKKLKNLSIEEIK